MRYIIFVCIVIIVFPLEVGAYGWGFVKGNGGQAPEIGKYKTIIENHQAFYVDETDEKVVYLTFDNGYEAGYTSQILDVLEKEKVPATFFVTGHYAKEEADLMRRMVKDGHMIGNHSDSHPDFTTMSKVDIATELNKLEEIVRKETGQKQMTYVRPPRGTFDESTLETIDELGYVHVFWSLAFKDWEQDAQKGWKYAYDQIMEQMHPGAVLLLHSVSEDNAVALEKVIRKLKKDGYRFGHLDEIVQKKWLYDYLIY